MPRLLITYNYPVQKLERISIYDNPTTQKTSNGTCLSRTDSGESLVTDIPIGKLINSYLCLPYMAKRSGLILSRS